ncbi:MAG: hypothetical protein V2A79_09695 [Planctomycetota bacterium]
MRIVTAIVSICLAVCPEQQFKDPIGAPFTIDPGRIALDPETGRQLCLGWEIVDAGVPCVYDANYCDPEGDPVTVTVEEPAKYALTVDGNDIHVSFRPGLGVHYITLTATDEPGPTALAKTRKGTYVILALRPNQPPTIGCGSVRR